MHRDQLPENMRLKKFTILKAMKDATIYTNKWIGYNTHLSPEANRFNKMLGSLEHRLTYKQLING